MREAGEEAVAGIHAGGDGGSDQDGSSRGGASSLSVDSSSGQNLKLPDQNHLRL